MSGQPDSYVGDSARSCRIAVCYTVQQKSWWTKVVADVKEALAASPNVEEIIEAFPWDGDRDGPTKEKASTGWARRRRRPGRQRFPRCTVPRSPGSSTRITKTFAVLILASRTRGYPSLQYGLPAIKPRSPPSATSGPSGVTT